MRFFKVLGLVILGLVVVVAVSGYLFIRSFDLNKYKPYISEVAEKQLGRKLAINGNAELGISLVPTLIINDVELANPVWAQNPEMVKMGKLEIKLALMPLLKRKVVVDNITLIKPIINLEVAANGEASWDFKKTPKIGHQQLNLMKDQAIATGLVDMKTADKAVAIVNENPAAAALAGFAAKNILIENGSFNFINQQTGQNINVELIKLAMSAGNMDDEVKAEFEVLFNGNNIKGSTVLGAPNLLLDGGTEAYPVALNATAYGVILQLDGNVWDALKKPSFSVNADIHNPQGNFEAPDVKLLTKIEGNLQNIKADIASLNINGNVLNGTVIADIANSVPYITANLNSDKLDVQSMLPPAKTAWDFSLIKEANASQMVPNKVIPYALLNQVNAKALINVKTLIVNPDLTMNNVTLNASVLNGVLNVNPLQMNVGGGELNATMVVNASNASVKIMAVSKGIIAQDLYSKLRASPNSANFGFIEGGNTDININLVGSGMTYRQLVDSLNGQAIVIVDKSIVHPGTLDILTGNFIMQILNTLKLNKSNEKELDLSCAVVRADFANGMVNFPKGIAINSKQLNLVSDGKFNLVSDGLDFSVRPYSGKVIDANIAQALTSFIKIKGTAQEPKIVLDDKQAIKALAGIAATGGTAYLGSQLMLDNDATPCYTALKGTVYQNRFPAPTAIQKTEQDIYQGADGAVNDGLNAAKTTGKDAAKDLKKSVKDLENAAKGLLKSFK